MVIHMTSVSTNRAKALANVVGAVAPPPPLADRILEEVQRSPDCELDAVLRLPEEDTWQDVLLEVHRLSTMGQLQAPRGARASTPSV